MDPLQKSLSDLRNATHSPSKEVQPNQSLDQIALRAFKRLKVRLGERVELIEWVSRRGGAMPIPVVRRRPLRPAFLRRT